MQLLGRDIKVLYSQIREIQDKAVHKLIISRADNYSNELYEIDLEYMACNKLIGLDDDRVIQLLRRFNALKAKIVELEKIQLESSQESTNFNEIQRMESDIEKLGNEDEIKEFQELYASYKRIDSDTQGRGKEHYREKMGSLHVKVILNNIDILRYLLLELCDPKNVYHDEAQAIHWKTKGIVAAENDDKMGMREVFFSLHQLSSQDTITTLSERELPPDLRG